MAGAPPVAWGTIYDEGVPEGVAEGVFEKSGVEDALAEIEGVWVEKAEELGDALEVGVGVEVVTGTTWMVRVLVGASSARAEGARTAATMRRTLLKCILRLQWNNGLKSCDMRFQLDRFCFESRVWWGGMRQKCEMVVYMYSVAFETSYFE